MMKSLHLVFVLFFVACNGSGVSWLKVLPEFQNGTFPNFRTFIKKVTQEFEQFKLDYRRVYETKEEERQRFFAFSDNFMFVKKVNYLYAQGKSSYNASINQFSDVYESEIKARRCFNPTAGQVKVNTRTNSLFSLSPNALNLPKSKDWREHNCVTEVKDQGKCGSCYAFAAMGSLECQHFLKTGLLLSLSVQQIVDCSEKFGNMACSGGKINFAFDYVLQNGGIDTAKSYPYVSGKTKERQLACYFHRKTVGANIINYVNVTPSGNERMLKHAINTVGPIAVGIDAEQRSFINYAGGVYYEPLCRNDLDNLNHAVLVVGYGVENGIEYWLVKNSWGVQWGMDGYIKMRRNAFNMCGIATAAIYPIA